MDLDKERFEEQFAGGENGYYDKVEKIFIPQRIFKLLLEEISPRKDRKQFVDIERSFLDKSRKRVAQNLLQVRSLGRDSYSQIFLKYLSDAYLLKNKNQRIRTAVLYIDLVGSTALTTILLQEQLTILLKVFFQEMSILISRNSGFVLKYAGDAVIGYFPEDPDVQNASQNAVNCAMNMLYVVSESINVVLFENKYPKLRIRIAIDEGENQIVVIGSEPDLLGHVISRAAKIMAKANPNQIIIGNNVFINLDPNLRQRFSSAGTYKLPNTQENYSVFVANSIRQSRER